MKKKEEEKKDKISDMMTKDSVKKDDDEKKEEKPDTRGMYAKINIIKNKLRAAGQRDPMVMAVDACEENINEMKPIPTNKTNRPPQTTTSDKPLPNIDIPDKKPIGTPKPQGGVPNTERTPAPNDKSFDKMRPGGSNSQYEKDGTKKKPKYNPYGTGTANPSNMSGSTGP